jgi:predicted short-subunit dehydrogenase-like oxidoreductase (DUF2520 family)
MPDDFRVLVIAVQDDEIQSVAAELSTIKRIDWEAKVVIHTSGVKSVESLLPLKKRGAAVGAFHPIAAFANEYQPQAVYGIYCDFFGDKVALSLAREITAEFGSKLIVLHSEQQRILLHIASVIASNSTVVAIRSAESLISDFVGPVDVKALMAGLLRSTVRNLQKNNGIKSLTGPLARGDAEVVSDHIKALESNKRLLQFYKSWSLLGVEMLSRARPEKKAQLKKIRRILSQEIGNPSEEEK